MSVARRPCLLALIAWYCPSVWELSKERTGLVHDSSSHTVRHTPDQETSPEADLHQRPALFGLPEVFLGGEAGHDHGGNVGEELVLAVCVSLDILIYR